MNRQQGSGDKEPEFESRLFPSRMFPGLTPDDIKRGLWIMLGMSAILLLLIAMYGKDLPEQDFHGDIDAYTQALNQDESRGTCVIATHVENRRRPHKEVYAGIDRLGDCFAKAHKIYTEKNPKGYNVGYGLVEDNHVDVVAQGYCGLHEPDNSRKCSASGHKVYRLHLD